MRYIRKISTGTRYNRKIFTDTRYNPANIKLELNRNGLELPWPPLELKLEFRGTPQVSRERDLIKVARDLTHSY